MADLAKVIENCNWVEFEAWLDAHHDLLIHHHEAESPDSSIGSVPSLVQREPPPRVQAHQSQTLTERNETNFLALWLFIRLTSRFCIILNTIVRFSCLGDRAPCLPDVVDSFSS